jgi:acyl-CoA thioesterase
MGERSDGGGALDFGRLGRALALARTDGGWTADADARYAGFNGMFGGWTAALLLAAISHDADVGHVPASLTVNYVAPIRAGSQVGIHTRRLGGGRSVSHWSAQLSGNGSDAPLTTATAVLATRRPTDSHVQVAMPEAPAPETLVEWHPPNTVGSLLDVRPVKGFPPYGRLDTASLDWVRETSGRPMDHVQLALLADACAPRPFFWSDAPRPSATLTMTVYFHATDIELAAVGDDYVLNEVSGARGNESIADQSLRTWSRNGILLASCSQLCSYR